MRQYSAQTIFHSFIYGGASVLLAIDLFFLIKAVFQQNFVPILPVIVSILLSGGLVLILYGERQSRMLDRGEFRRLTRVAHQLEHPLNTLKDDFNYLITNADKLPAEERMKLKRMDTKTKVLLDNIRDLFLVLRAHYGSITDEKRVYDVCAVVHDAVEKVQAFASSRNVEIVEKAHCPDASALLDRSMFQIALTELIENAVIYNRTPGLVNVSIMKGKKTVRIIIKDRGVGIHENDLWTVLNPFARGEQAEISNPDGIGVGLTLAKLIVSEHTGSLTFRRREKGIGTEVELTLPLANPTK